MHVTHTDNRFRGPSSLDRRRRQQTNRCLLIVGHHLAVHGILVVAPESPGQNVRVSLLSDPVKNTNKDRTPAFAVHDEIDSMCMYLMYRYQRNT